LVLLPVRIETRFVTGRDGTDLLVRIYPDEVHVDTHERELTADEEKWGRHFWIQSWRAGNSEEGKERRKTAWAQLAERFGPERAAWIAHALEPLNESERPTLPLPEDESLAVEPNFPEVPLRSGSWTRAAYTNVLPDRWVALGYRGGKRTLTQWGDRIPDVLPTGPSPGAPAPEVGDDALEVDEGMRWMVDFSEAVKVGMGVRIKLTPSQAQQGFERLIVLGVKASLDGTDSAKRLGALFEAHHYGRGIAFVPQGTPTNNTADMSSGYRREHSPDWSYQVERQDPLFNAGDGSNGDVAAKVLGIEPSLFQHLEHAGDKEQEGARHMNAALWSATWGYFLEQMLAQDAKTFSDEALRHGRRHFIEYVRARGPLPVLRVGNQPYGLLPVTSLEGWQSLRDAPKDAKIDGKVVDFLRTLRDVWRRSLAAVPHVGRPGDPDLNVLQILGMEPTSSSYFARPYFAKGYIDKLWWVFEREPTEVWWSRQKALAEAAVKTVTLPWTPRIAQGLFAPRAYPLPFPLVQADASPGVMLAPNYIDWLLQSGYQAVRAETYPGDRPRTLLYLLLRHAFLLEYGAAAFRLRLTQGLETRAERFERELLDMERDGETPTVWGRLSLPVRGITGEQTVGGYLDRLRNYDRPEVADLAEFRSSLTYLQGQPARLLEQLLVETIDLCSHRLDAWATSYATKRLHELRKREPNGIYIGGYGWVEEIRPAVGRSQVSPPPGEGDAPVYVAEGNAGFVHAPSLAQAATAAILRSGYLSHPPAAEDGTHPFAIDLSSDRVRLAQWLIDGVRQGQPLGVLLGYQFERGLHENHPDLELDQYIQPFRELAPLVAKKLVDEKREEKDEPVEAIAANNVVDGLALHRIWKTNGIPWGGRLPPKDEHDRDYRALSSELKALDDAVDAVTDAAIAESVYQVVQGNAFRAGAVLDAVNRGEGAPPELEVVRTPRTGIGVTHRILVLLGDPPPATPEWPSTPRAQAEPYLNAWAARLLGDPASVSCRALYLKPGALNPANLQPEDIHPPQMVRLSELKLSPLDVLYMAEGTGQAQQSELEQHLLYHIRTIRPEGIPADAQTHLVFDRQPDSGPESVSFAELIEVARTARALVTGARALEASDLLLPEQPEAGEIDTQELDDRADTAVQAFQDAWRQLKLLTDDQNASAEALREALLDLSYFGLPGSVPLSTAGESSEERKILLDQAKAVEKEATRRLEKVRVVEEGEDVARLRSVFGDVFQVLPRIKLKPAHADELRKTFAASDALQGKDVSSEDPLPVVTWFQRIARVREGAARLDATLMYGEALASGTSLELAVGQLPHEENDRWVALPLKGKRLQGGRLSLVVHPPWTLDLTKPLGGLLIDEWVEVVPNERELTGLAFHFDQPDACAPQAILLAVPPHDGKPWNLEALEAVVLETLEWAKLRCVDPDALGELGHFLPALYFADNVSNDTVATNFTRAALELLGT
jgi:hypothetical protein